jgi:diguanylate cyclase (GGDEF)-like protein
MDIRNKHHLTVEKLNTKSRDTLSKNPRQSLELSIEAQNLAMDSGFQKGLADAYLNQGWCYIHLAQNYDAIKILNQCQDVYDEIKSKNGTIQVNNALGVAYNAIHHYDTALKYFSTCIELCNKFKINEPLAKILGNIGLIYLDLGKNDKALDYCQRAMKISLPPGLGRDRHLCLSFFNIGRVYINLNKTDQAVTSLRHGLNMARKTDNKIIESACFTHLGKVFSLLNDFKSSEEYLNQGLSIAREVNDLFGELQGLIGQAELLARKGENEQSFIQYEKALELAKSIDSSLYEYRIHKAVSKLHEKSGDFKQALKHYKKYVHSKTEIIDKEAESRLTNLTLQYDINATKNEARRRRLEKIELQESYDRMTTINKIGQRITASLDISKILKMIYQHIRHTLEGNILGIALYDDHSREIDYKFFIEDGNSLKLPRLSVDVDDGLGAWCIRNRKALMVNNEKDALNYVNQLSPLGDKEKKGKMAQSVIFVLLKIEERIIGLMTIQSYLPNIYQSKDVEMLKTLASYVAIALENSNIHSTVRRLNKIIQDEKKELEMANEKISHMANHDKLTGLPNRRLFSELVRSFIKVARRNNTQLALLFMDLDNFKPLNDEYGHEFGDLVLQAIGHRLSALLRESDTCARIGGDEFVALISDFESRDDVTGVIEKIISSITAPMHINDIQCHVGVSIGASIFPDDASNVKMLLKHADSAMYRVKTDSKNGYCYFNQ